MNLASARVVIRPRERLELLDLAFRYVLGESRADIGRLGLFTLVPAFGVTAAARALFGWEWWEVWLLAVALGGVVSGVFTVASARLLFESKLHVGAVLRAYAARFRPLVVALLLSRTICLIGCLAVVPGLLMWGNYYYVSEAVLLEQVPVRRALSRSSSLAKVRGNDAIGLTLAITFFSLLIAAGFDAICSAVVGELLVLPVSFDSLWTSGGSYFAIAGYFASVPWSAASRFLAYADGRTRQDGWDVQIRLMALSESAG